MPRDGAATAPELSRPAVPAVWRRSLLALAIVWIACLALFSSDWAAMARQWWNISTYNHILLVPLIVGWLAWQRREALFTAIPQPSRWGIIAVVAALLIWLLGSVSGFSLLRQTGAVALLPATYLLLLGPRAVALQFFPLAYMAFLVPFGDELVVPLQMITATITIALVRLSGIPAAIEGVFIDTPAGLFEVAEACSGVKFLIAMVALGVLISHLYFTSWRRRAGFMVLCLVVPILANGLRAFAIVYVAQYLGAERATGVDHIIYGWIFFAMVIAAVLAIAWRFFDRAIDDPIVYPEKLGQSLLLNRLDRGAIGFGAAVTVFVAVLAAVQAWAIAADRVTARVPAQLFLPEVPGWTRVDYAPRFTWEPKATGAKHRLLGSYANADGAKVDVFVAVYAAQREGQEAGGFGEGALRPDSGWSWEAAGPPESQARTEWLRARNSTVRLAATTYRTGDLTTGSNMQLKLATIADRLLLRARPTVTLILSTERQPIHDPAATLEAFRKATGPVDQWMDRTAGLR